MAYTVPAAPGVGQQAYTISDLLQLMGGANPPANVAFPAFNYKNTRNLLTGQAMPVQGSPVPEMTRAVGLISCGSVCFLNTANRLAYVLHANVGHVSQAQFMNAMVAIVAGPPPHNTVCIAYAHPDPTDPGYQGTVADFINWGVPTNNIVEITNLALYMFGMNNLLQIGY